MSGGDQHKACESIGPLLFFFVCDEVSAEERVAVEEHLAICAACREQLATERALQSDLTSLPQASDLSDPAGVLLSQCRSELSEKLDDLGAPKAKEKWFSFFWLQRWLTFHPAWSAALLILFGLVAGVQGTQWLTGLNNAVALDHAVNVRPEMKFTDEQLSKMAVAGVNFTANPGEGRQHVRVQLSAQQPLELTGSVDDGNVRRVLSYVVVNGNRFDPGLRLDCLEVLKLRSGDVEVRGALVAAARKDQNPAVRLKALEALRDESSDRAVREMLLDSLRHDTNPGVRVEAVNLLVRSLEAPKARKVIAGSDATNEAALAEVGDLASLDDVLRTLEVLQHTDPSQYVRLRSAAALREIGEPDEH